MVITVMVRVRARVRVWPSCSVAESQGHNRATQGSKSLRLTAGLKVHGNDRNRSIQHPGDMAQVRAQPGQ